MNRCGAGLRHHQVWRDGCGTLIVYSLWFTVYSLRFTVYRLNQQDCDAFGGLGAIDEGLLDVGGL